MPHPPLKPSAQPHVKGDGRVNLDEVSRALEKLGASIPRDQLRRLVEQADTRHDGVLDCDAFTHVIDEAMRLRRSQSSAHVNIDSDALEAAQLKRHLFEALLRVVVYMVVGGLYGFFRQGWQVMDTIYFVVVTATTVGYGDMSFVNGEWWEKVFGGVYVFCGVAFIGSAFGTLLDAMAFGKEMRHKKEAGDLPPFDLDKEIKKLRVALYKRLGVILVTIAIGTVILVQLEHEQEWTYADGFYFACITMTTVGYGDLEAKSAYGKMFTTVYILSGFGVIASAISSLASFPMEVRRLTNFDKVLNQFGDSMDEHELIAICESEELERLRTKQMVANAGDHHHVTRSEWVLWQLMKQRKLDFHEDMAPCLNVFDKLDYDGSGDVSSPATCPLTISTDT